METASAQAAHTADLAHLERATEAFAALVPGADLDRDVPSCPGWKVRDVVWHLGGIHLWAATAVLEARAAEETHEGPPDAELAGWYRGAAEHLREALAKTPVDQEVWAFGPRPRRVTFWSRRQVHETNLHLWDARAALGQDATAAFPPETAADGVDEVLSMFYPRQVRLNRIPALTRAITLVDTDGGRQWTVGDADPEAVVSGPAVALDLLLWRRIGPEHPALEVTGDREAVRDVVTAGLTP